jgi:hypothetical protein
MLGNAMSSQLPEITSNPHSYDQILDVVFLLIAEKAFGL